MDTLIVPMEASKISINSAAAGGIKPLWHQRLSSGTNENMLYHFVVDELYMNDTFHASVTVIKLVSTRVMLDIFGR